MIGVDEVGRGCWAGPMLVVAARTKTELPAGLKDSKLLSKTQREEILNKLSICCQFGEGWVSAAEIDKLGLSKATKLGIKKALEDLSASTKEEIILDGKTNYLPEKFINGRAEIDADNLVPIVSAASIYAKVKRDDYMADLGKRYPAYGFEKHVGYGTKLHIEALGASGFIKEIHRLSYAPLAKFAEAAT
jgi:ribonuclease HII